MARDLFPCLLLGFLLQVCQSPHILIKSHSELLGRPVAEYVIDVKGDDFVATIRNIRGFERLIRLLSPCAGRKLDECFGESADRCQADTDRHHHTFEEQLFSIIIPNILIAFCLLSLISSVSKIARNFER